MTKDPYLLPDLSQPVLEYASNTTEGSRPVTPSRIWTQHQLDHWLSSSQLAAWARDWLKAMGHALGGPLEELLPQAVQGQESCPEWMKNGRPEPIWLRNFLRRSDLAHEWFRSGYLVDDPPWLEKLLRYEKAKVARSFLLSGNIGDYAFDPVHGFRPTIRVLIDSLLRVKDCVLTYRLSQGLTFHSSDPDCRQRLPDSVQNLLECGAFDTEMPLLSQVCSIFDELRQWLTGNGPGDDLDNREFPRGVAILFENIHLVVPTSRADVERNFLVDNLLHWSISPELFRSSHCLILLAESLEDVGNELRARGGKIEQVEVSRPETAESRLKFLIPLLDPDSRMNETRVARLSTGRGWLGNYGVGSYLERLRRLSSDTAGLSLIGIEDLLQQASARVEAQLSREEVMELKRQRLRQESDGLLEVVDPKRDLSSIGGYSDIKSRLREVVSALQNAQDPLVRTTVPMGMLFLGPPGTGKSIVAEALAGESGISMAKLGDFRGMYVGESERNLTRILSLIEALYPVIVFVDEIDQAFGNRSSSSGDSGVDSRIFGRLLEFLSDTEHRGKILWIGASNFPDRLDPAMKRAGRFDLALPFLLPDEKSRADILRVILEGSLRKIDGVEHQLTTEEFEGLARRTEGFSGAELGAIIGETLRREAQRRTQGGQGEAISVDLFSRVLDAYRPPQGARKSYRRMEALAIQEVSFLDLLPEDRRVEVKS